MCVSVLCASIYVCTIIIMLVCLHARVSVCFNVVLYVQFMSYAHIVCMCIQAGIFIVFIMLVCLLVCMRICYQELTIDIKESVKLSNTPIERCS